MFTVSTWDDVSAMLTLSTSPGVIDQDVRKTPKKGRYHHGDLSRALLDAALVLVAEGGVGALTLRETARRAGVSHAAPYRHFKDLEALLVAIATEGFGLLNACFEDARNKTQGDYERFEAGGLAYVQFALHNLSHYRVMFSPALVGRFGEHPTLAMAPMEAFKELLNLVDEALGAGILRDDIEPDAIATSIWAFVHGLCSLALDDHLMLDEEQVKNLTRADAQRFRKTDC